MGSHEQLRETGRRRATVALGGRTSTVRTGNGQEDQTQGRDHQRIRRDARSTPTVLDGYRRCPGEAWRDGVCVTFAVEAGLSLDHVEQP